MAGPVVPAQGGKGLVYKFYSASDSWTCPPGVTRVILIGVGGGGGGTPGYASTGLYGQGGYGSVPGMVVATVVPNTTYSITIGSGGFGNGQSGGYTTFGSGLGAFGVVTSAGNYTGMRGGFSMTSGNGNSTIAIGNRGYRSLGGNKGSDASGYRGGGGGGCGVTGPGGNGGNGVSSGTGAAGSSASSTNYGAGGGASGSGPSGSTYGGSGAGGCLWVIWCEDDSKLTQVEFTSSGSWTAPAGVTSIIALGQGGGGSGNDSTGTVAGANGGKATYLVPMVLNVTPNTTYTVTIGAGGISAGNGGSGLGGDTSLGALFSWFGAGGGAVGAGYSTAGSNQVGTSSVPTNMPWVVPGASNGSDTSQIPGNFAVLGSYAARGTNGTGGSSAGGGGGSGASSDSGIGGAGGKGGNNPWTGPSDNPGNGGDAPAGSYGAGGGGGGGDGSGFGLLGLGGNGGGGRLIILWAE